MSPFVRLPLKSSVWQNTAAIHSFTDTINWKYGKMIHHHHEFLFFYTMQYYWTWLIISEIRSSSATFLIWQVYFQQQSVWLLRSALLPWSRHDIWSGSIWLDNSLLHFDIISTVLALDHLNRCIFQRFSINKDNWNFFNHPLSRCRINFICNECDQ